MRRSDLTGGEAGAEVFGGEVAKAKYRGLLLNTHWTEVFKRRPSLWRLCLPATCVGCIRVFRAVTPHPALPNKNY